MSYTRLLYHVVTSTKDRRPFLSPEFLPRVQQYLGGMIKTQGGQPIEINGPEDHIHVVASLPPTISLAEALKDLKAKSSHWIHNTFAELGSFAWQDGYAAFTVSPSVLPRVVSYVQGQQEHHNKVSFIEELKALLDKHGIEYDARYLV